MNEKEYKKFHNYILGFFLLRHKFKSDSTSAIINNIIIQPILESAKGI